MGMVVDAPRETVVLVDAELGALLKFPCGVLFFFHPETTPESSS
jgi:hypothetical protein